MPVVQCSIRPGHRTLSIRDHGDMKKFDALSHKLLALAVVVIPAAALVLDQLDQSMRRPTLAGVLYQSLKLAF